VLTQHTTHHPRRRRPERAQLGLVDEYSRAQARSAARAHAPELAAVEIVELGRGEYIANAERRFSWLFP
jgi:hypothetical protein